MKSKIYSLALIGVILICFTAFNYGCSDVNGDGLSVSGMKALSAAQEADIDAFVTQKMAEHKIPGVIVAVYEADKIPYILVKGTAEVAANRPLEATDRFRIGSITKTFTATVILQLAGERKLNLDESVLKYFPDLPNASKITVHHLLNMTSGLANYTDDNNIGMTLLSNPAKKFTQEEIYSLIKSLSSKAVLSEPGAVASYNNSNYFLLGMIIEKVTGSKAGDEIKRRICDRLGMNDTYMSDSDKIDGAHSMGYIADGTLTVEFMSNPSWCWTAGAMVSTLADVKKYIKAMVTCELCPKYASERLAWRELRSYANPYGAGTVKMSYGLGIANFGGMAGHNGAILGYSTLAVYYQPRDITVIILTNKFMDTPVHSEEILRDRIFGIVLGSGYPVNY
ncbi:MAG TPA: serine hydrolase domain-containing protein [Candidatus Wallbacteria bacterium]|nr:serine hydrolase domain-containing protein [Candidatus Wallbacteria bacterium]